MRKLLTTLFCILLVISLGFLIHKDSGYVMVSYNGYTLESSLWISIAGLFVFFYVIYFFIRFAKNILSLGGKYRRYESKHRAEKSRLLTNKGLCDLAEGNWREAQIKLSKAAKHNPNPLINYLACARAAQAALDYNARDDYLRRAHLSTPNAEVAIGLSQATLQIDGKQWEQALATLNHLNQITPNHRYSIKLLSDVYLELNDWLQLQKLLPKLKRLSILDDTHIEALDKKIHLNLLRNATKANNADNLHEVWEALPKKWHHDSELVKLYTDYLIEQKNYELSTELIAKFLRKNWNADLVTNYGLSPTEHINAQISTAESWLEKHSGEPELLLCIGRLCYKGNFLGKAEYMLTNCIAVSSLPEAYFALGQVLEALGKREDALMAYKKGAN